MIAFVLSLFVEYGYPRSGSILRLREDFGDPRTFAAGVRWQAAVHQAKVRQRAVRMDIEWRHR